MNVSALDLLSFACHKTVQTDTKSHILHAEVKTERKEIKTYDNYEGTNEVPQSLESSSSSSLSSSETVPPQSSLLSLLKSSELIPSLPSSPSKPESLLTKKMNHYPNRPRSYSMGDIGDEGGDVPLPELSRFSSIYNQNGHIGIYSSPERQTLISRHLLKKSSRNWKKKIRYSCRKNLADRRMRVKGRFVKREDDEVLKKERRHSVAF
ncbi:hypothetical protein TrVE_jg12813 [Triparma verrucosa]|uniref:CCT domain-containing protein n=1 Tax=Triparma verrucosa TaxID=1606542 RepID=A0A9W7CBR3_9STRA|nr:hypothetical protein TrVE_jg12813 [Triparma verrucosa]